MQHDYGRLKAILVGCLGVSVVAFVGLYFMMHRMLRMPGDGQPCVRAANIAQPLLIGDTIRYTIGAVRDGSDCAQKAWKGFVWSTTDNTVIELQADGLVRGVSPGNYVLIARRGDAKLTANGFVLPPEWKARLAPESANLRVGDSVVMVVRPVDKNGAPLPSVPFSIFTPESFDPATQKKPIVNQLAWQNTLDPVVVKAVDTGTTTLVGRIGIQQVTARLVIAPR